MVSFNYLEGDGGVLQCTPQAPHRPLLGGGQWGRKHAQCYIQRNIHTTIVKLPKAARRLLQAAQPLVVIIVL
jgi:hypothetical protein